MPRGGNNNSGGGDSKPQRMVVWDIQEVEGRDKAFWNRCGVGWMNRDGSINFTLEYLPLPRFKKDGTPYRIQMQIKKYEPKESSEGESFSE